MGPVWPLLVYGLVNCVSKNSVWLSIRVSVNMVSVAVRAMIGDLAPAIGSGSYWPLPHVSTVSSMGAMSSKNGNSV